MGWGDGASQVSRRRQSFSEPPIIAKPHFGRITTQQIIVSYFNQITTIHLIMSYCRKITSMHFIVSYFGQIACGRWLQGHILGLANGCPKFCHIEFYFSS